MSAQVLVLTPVKDPSYLPAIYDNLSSVLSGFDWTWFIQEDNEPTTSFRPPERWQEVVYTKAPKEQMPLPTFSLTKTCALSHVGHPLRNLLLDRALKIAEPEAVICHLDADNLLHPDFAKWYWRFHFEGQANGKIGYTVWQQYVDGSVRLRPIESCPPVVDTGAFFALAKAIGDIRFRCDPALPAEDWYAADQTFFQDLYAGREAQWIHFGHPGALYNALTQHTGPYHRRSPQGFIGTYPTEPSAGPVVFSRKAKHES